MYGSEVVYVRKTENPDYCLVYYNSNESELGLGLVPEEHPVLTDGKGNKLAYDRLDVPQNGGSDHFYVLDDKVVVVSGVTAEERYKPNPVLEMERDSGLLRQIVTTFRTDVVYLDGGIQREPHFYEDALVSMLSSHDISFAYLKNAYTYGLIAHRLEASGMNVTAACEDAAKELGIAQPFRKYLDEFFSDSFYLVRVGRIIHAEVDYCFLDDVSNKFPEVYKKVRDSVPDVKALDVRLDRPVVEKPLDSESQAYRDGVFDVLHGAYKVACPTNEVVRGNYAKEFCGEPKWSRALDFPIPGMPDAKGLRYIDFKDCTLVRLLMKDGNSKPIENLTMTELGMVRNGLQKALKPRKGIRM